ncbi:unnamed protein product, partial [Mesorhabditis belari]|uniref:Nematode cuticle collagen N-terminal domain-containing protein n=1 Tax=Mesorhabditis belari TaxID=2138241 RepID=A0AAF3F4Z7_9BILA
MKCGKLETNEKIPNRLAKLAIVLSLSSLLFLISMTLIISSVLNEMELELDNVFLDVNRDANEMWSELMAMGSRGKRQLLPAEYEVVTEYAIPYTTSQNSYQPKYGYGYTKLKCCCADSYAKPGINENLPISYKCPLGYKGPPGPQGESGEPGSAGVPGYPGTPATNIYPETRLSSLKSATYNSYPSDQYVSSNQYAQPQLKICDEPCPIGPPGPCGPKGSRGIVGHKGIRGAFGEPGRPGKSGKCGHQGDIGPRGINGFSGPKGPSGANGVKGCKGSPGRKGISGPIGVVGPRGLGGQPGDYGAPGVPGLCGQPGPKGPQGIDGASGSGGASGRPGKDGLYCPCPPKSQQYSQPPQQPYPIPFGLQYEQVVGGSSQENLGVLPDILGDSEASYTGIPRKAEENLPLQSVSVPYFGDSFTSAPQPPAPPPQEIADYIAQNFANGEGVKRADPKPRSPRKK